MDETDALLAFAALSQSTRLDVFRLLMAFEPTGLAAGEIARRLAVPQNTMSSHLGVLTRAGLISAQRRSRSIQYRAEAEKLDDLVRFLTKDCCGGTRDACPGRTPDEPSHPNRSTDPEEALVIDRPYNVLFLCTGNTARSILAESILRKDGAGRFNAFSAGSRPKGEVNPLALKVLERFEYPIDGLRSKGWDEFSVPEAPVMDFVFTVCDNAAGEACPVWPGQPVTAHWGIEDPAAVEGSDIARETAFNAAFRYLERRISAFTALPLASLDRLALGNRLRDIGQLAGATTLAGGQ
jgi:arsenate reductase